MRVRTTAAKIKLVVGAAALVVGGLGLAAPAQAAFSDCDANKVCMWGSNGFVFMIGERDGGGGNENLSGDANNSMDSWGNRSTGNARGRLR